MAAVGAHGARTPAWDVDGADGAFDVDDLDDLDGGPLDLDDPWQPPQRTRPRRSRRTALVVCAGAAVLVGAVALSSSLLRSPQERLERRLTDAVLASGAQLAARVELSAGRDDGSTASDGAGGDDVVWTGRLQVVEDGTTTSTRVAIRLTPEQPDQVVPSLFPQVDCDGPYPLTWPGDSDTSYRTTREDLSECFTSDSGDGVLVTIGWRDDEDSGYGRYSSGGGSGLAEVDRQTWRAGADGGLVWLRSRGDGDGGLTGEQQRAVASAEGLLERL